MIVTFISHLKDFLLFDMCVCCSVCMCALCVQSQEEDIRTRAISDYELPQVSVGNWTQVPLKTIKCS